MPVSELDALSLMLKGVRQPQHPYISSHKLPGSIRTGSKDWLQPVCEQLPFRWHLWGLQYSGKVDTIQSPFSGGWIERVHQQQTPSSGHLRKQSKPIVLMEGDQTNLFPAAR